MENWLKQTTDKPLYPDVIWSKPENKNGAGKLLIIGGSAGNFAHVAKSYSQAEQAGAGTIHLLVPDSLRAVTKQIPFINYAPSNPSGGFAKQALAEVLETAKNIDGALLAGDMGKNSETTLMLEELINKVDIPLFIAPEAVESFTNFESLLVGKNTVLCLTQNQLRDLFIQVKSETAITSSMQKPNFAKVLRDFSQKNLATLIIEFNGDIWLANNGNVVESVNNFSPAKSAVWAIQQPEKLFQTLVSSTI